MVRATLCFLTNGNPPDEVLLGLKKTGFGQGKWGGFGGKVEAGETVEAAAVRELQEEAGIKVSEADIQKVAVLSFLFPHKPSWSQVVHVFLVQKWNGEAAESVEMMPAWFKLEQIPYDQMWDDGRYWLPLVLDGERINARFTFKDDNETVDQVRMEKWR